MLTLTDRPGLAPTVYRATVTTPSVPPAPTGGVEPAGPGYALEGAPRGAPSPRRTGLVWIAASALVAFVGMTIACAGDGSTGPIAPAAFGVDRGATHTGHLTGSSSRSRSSGAGRESTALHDATRRGAR